MNRLQALGFVERTPSPVSRRELELRLTVRCKTYLRELRARREDALLAAIETMAPAARAALLKGLRGFRAAVEEKTAVHRPHVRESASRTA